jgi:hypothetical protein
LVGQNPTTGVVDYLKYSGTNLVASNAKDYGLGAGFKIVANGNFNADAFPDLVAQNAAGQLDFLYLNATGSLIGSFLTTNPYPAVHGQGFFNGFVGTQQGPALVSQLPDGSIDILSFGPVGAVTEQLVGSDLIPGTVGLPKLIGASNKTSDFAAFNQITPDDTAALFTQLPNGTLDIIGLKGSTVGATLTISNTLLLSQTAGSSPGFVVNPDFSGGTQRVPSDVPGTGAGAAQLFGVQVVTESAAFIPDILYLDSGYGTSTTEGQLYASQFLQELDTLTLVEGSFVAQQIFGAVT